jgi:hypothetical protein
MTKRVIELEPFEASASEGSRSQNMPNHAELIDRSLEMSIKKSVTVDPRLPHALGEPPPKRNRRPRNADQAVPYRFDGTAVLGLLCGSYGHPQRGKGQRLSQRTC